MANCIIISGMGRSGTSLIASIIQKIGVNIGERLVAPGKANPRGFFEDEDFYKFHEGLLLERGHSILVPPDFVFEPTDREIEKAQHLIELRREKAMWGWKDPRTSLFLDFWYQLLPEAFFVFVYRHPLEVLLSLLRSNVIYNAGLLEGIESWYSYNTKIKEFYEKHPDRCVLCHTYAIVDRVGEFTELLENKFDLNLSVNATSLASLYHPEELRRVQNSAEITALLKAIHPKSIELYDELNALADLPFTQPEGEPSAELMSIYAFASSLSQSLQRSQARGMLLLLIASLEPNLPEDFFQEYGSYINQFEHSKVWLEEQLTNWQAETERRGEVIAAQQHQIEEYVASIKQLEAARDHYVQQARNWQNIAEERAAWIKQLEAARDYYAQQARNWQNVAETVRSTNEKERSLRETSPRDPL